MHKPISIKNESQVQCNNIYFSRALNYAALHDRMKNFRHNWSKIFKNQYNQYHLTKLVFINIFAKYLSIHILGGTRKLKLSTLYLFISF